MAYNLAFFFVCRQVAILGNFGEAARDLPPPVIIRKRIDPELIFRFS